VSTSSTLALLGGIPVRPAGPPGWPIADADVLQALEAAYRDGSWGKYLGPHVERLEARLAADHQCEFALSCASGTFAVELALRGLQIGPGDEVLLAAYDYPGNFLSIHAVGARPVLLDIHADDWNLDPGGIGSAVSPASRALIVSHLHGGLVPMKEVMTQAAVHGLRVIEDAAQAPGALVQGRRAGTWGDAGILSFGGSKLLSAGRGGALLTRHADIHQRARTWMHRGNLLAPLSELQAAVLLPQLAKLEARNRQRTAAVEQLDGLLRGVPGLRPFGKRCPDSSAVYYKLGFQLDAAAFGMARDRFVAALRAEGMAFDEGFRAAHVGRSARRFLAAGALTEATRAHAGCVILHHPVLLGTHQDIEEVARALHKVYANARSMNP
jgi:dTDP-4-amino-4,6-dideoxygalactose transaminase